MATACTAAYCKRCGVFGHDNEGCVEECKRCGGRHGTRECFRKRWYIAAARGLPPETRPVTGNDHPSTSRPPTGTEPTSGLQVLRPRTRPHTTTNVPDHCQFEEPRGTEDARTVSATPAPLNAPKWGTTRAMLVQLATWTSRAAMNPALRNPPATPGNCRNLQARNKKCQNRRRAPRTTSLHSLVAPPRWSSG
ncbi:hypothetical protein HPB51_017097 [Rhipicephalus microplus]|uniref:Uncharacterized protein n=1 Tax=Rhipicephalus microplus TaxID=6941 RepID=A0A9J6DVF7_RHIMP|nr:hypothetical protein HPB51_017097 [Rhipicephalus microplus]